MAMVKVHAQVLVTRVYQYEIEIPQDSLSEMAVRRDAFEMAASDHGGDAEFDLEGYEIVEVTSG